MYGRSRSRFSAANSPEYLDEVRPEKTYLAAVDTAVADHREFEADDPLAFGTGLKAEEAPRFHASRRG
jgi:hypothetical protein